MTQTLDNTANVKNRTVNDVASAFTDGLFRVYDDCANPNQWGKTENVAYITGRIAAPVLLVAGLTLVAYLLRPEVGKATEFMQ